MKKFIKKSVSLLMAGAMVVMPASMSVQAKEANNNTTSIATARAYSYTSPALIKGNNVNLRSDKSTSSPSYCQLNNNTSVFVDKNNAEYANGYWWYPCKYGNLCGFVAAQYIYIIPT
ncbi:MAG: SH3 domain-containing protein [Lachnospiraceae bacterium]|nr:SH3 domain-containing protein [Lachnospiraceae bacterium]MDE6233861.1 SH3 domain-containing protein [Lachnospiraceae bacterium]MDE6252175.1 SH3 domain-containing protein [Lachnospiraceae bacterium]